MLLTATDKFTPGEYAMVSWYCSDAIDRQTLYKVIKRTPKRATIAAIYPRGLDTPIVVSIQNDNGREYAQHATTNYSLIHTYREAAE
jgi:hypothetical protein